MIRLSSGAPKASLASYDSKSLFTKCYKNTYINNTMFLIVLLLLCIIFLIYRLTVILSKYNKDDSQKK
jgi:hypothetical protein